MKNNNKTVIIIPSYEPPYVFTDYVSELVKNDDVEVVVVNDGSGKEFNRVYEKLETINKCKVLSYEVNKGKGHALKVALEYCKNNYSSEDNFVTADCDGQHLVKDVLNCANYARDNKCALILGCRDFNLPQVPKRSRMGNKSTRRMFSYLYGINVSDTQTGLRAFNYGLIDKLLSIKGERFEYEMNMLIQLPRKDVEFIEVGIDTVYEKKQEDVNTRSHFKTFRDSFKVWGVLLSNMSNFILAGIIAGIVEISLFSLVYYLFCANLVDQPAIRTLVSTVASRICSSIINFLICKKVVFHSKNKFDSLKYYCLWIAQMGASYLLTYIFGNLIVVIDALIVPIKLLGDIIIGLISYKIQQVWVFKQKCKRK